MRTFSHLMKFEGDTGQLAFLSRPSLGFLFCVVDTAVPAVSPWGQVQSPTGQGLILAMTGPLSVAPVSPVRWCAPRSPAQVPLTPRNPQWWVPRDHRGCWPLQIDSWGVDAAPEKLGTRDDLIWLHTCYAPPHPHPGSGVWLEPLDPMESLQPQL